MCSRAEAIEPELLGISTHAKRAVADKAGTEQGRNVHVVDSGGQRKAVARISDGVLRVAPVARVAREFCAFTEVILARFAVVAFAAGPGQPGHTYAVTNVDRINAST